MTSDLDSADNKQISPISVSRIESRKLIENSLPGFIAFCLDSEADFIVPIQNEGLAILLNSLKDRPDLTRKIFPSSSLAFLPEKEINDHILGKKGLVIDVSIRTGHSLTTWKNIVENMSGVAPICAALLVHSESSQKVELANPSPIFLAPNSYLWGRELIVELLMNTVIIQPGDPPMWDWKIESSSYNSILTAVLEMGNAFNIPGGNTNAEWYRVSIDSIIPTHSLKQLARFEISQPLRLRLSFNKHQNLVKILPLVFPKIPKHETTPIRGFLNHFSKELGVDLSTLSELAIGVPSTPIHLFRWVSASLSVLLLKDFFLRLRNYGLAPSESDISISAPVPNIYQYSCPKEVIDEFEEFGKKVIHGVSSTGPAESKQLEFTEQHYIFSDDADSRFKNPFQLSGLHSNCSPEEGLQVFFAGWLLDTESDNNQVKPTEEVIERTLANGIPFDRLIRKIDYMSPKAIGRAVDKLIDEGVLKPKVHLGDDDKYQRTYSIGTETIRRRLRTLGIANRLIGS